MTQIYAASTIFGAMTLAAGIDSGVLSTVAGGERILLASSNAAAPELVVPWHRTPIAESILARFDRVIFLNDDLHPYLPAGWEPRDADLPLLERALRSHWSLRDEPLHLVVAPSSALARIFHSASVTALTEGLAAYGPTRFKAPLHVIQRLESLAYLDLLPGVTPVRLPADDVPLAPVPADAFRAVVTELVAAANVGPEPIPDYSDRPTSLLLGQSLSALGITTQEEEVRLSLRMIDAAIEHGAERVVFKLHPTASPAIIESLRSEAKAKEAEFVVLTTSLPAEMLASKTRFDSVVSCFSTGIVTLSGMYGVTPIAVGSELLMGRIPPSANSSRIPLAIVDALTRPQTPFADPAGMQKLIDSVAYCMQPGVLAHLRPEALEFMTALPAQERLRYANRQQLADLGLILPAPPQVSPLRRLTRRVKRFALRLFGRAS
jgi:hypothetical protein